MASSSAQVKAAVERVQAEGPGEAQHLADLGSSSGVVKSGSDAVPGPVTEPVPVPLPQAASPNQPAASAAAPASQRKSTRKRSMDAA